MSTGATTSSVAPARTTRFARQVMLRTTLVGVAAFAALCLLAPWALMLESQVLTPLAKRGGLTAMVAVICIGLASGQVLRKNRFVLRSLALGSLAVEPEDIGALADLPFALTSRFVALGGLAPTALLIPILRPAGLDLARGISLCLLTWTIVLASAVVHYVVIRDATIRVLELSPVEPITEWLENPAARLAPLRRIRRKILVAVVAPVALVGVGTVLVTHAHLRALLERSQSATAIIMARTAFGPAPGTLTDAGRKDALATAAEFGFDAHIQRADGPHLVAEPKPTADHPQGRHEVVVPLEDGQAVVAYVAELSPGLLVTGALIALIAVLLAAGLGHSFGRALAKDLLLATEQVSVLGTEQVLRGKAIVAGPARFRIVADLGHAVDALTERFRVFARAQERAIEATERAQRMKQLLFASVSHDLKSPLNAILGFAELVRDDPLTPAQAESLDMVISRGRELLALIETILDAARVEAGGLELLTQPTRADELLEAALDKSRDLYPGDDIEVVVEMAPDMPPLLVDEAYAARAVAVFLSHAMQTASAEPGRALRVGGSVPARTRKDRPSQALMAQLQIEYASEAASPELVDAQLSGRSPSSAGRGVALRLSLARALIELHGGRVDVDRGPHGAAVVTCWLPIAS